MFDERMADRLVRLMGRFYARHPEVPGAEEEWFLAWLTRDARARQTAAQRRRTRERADAFAERVLVRVLATRLGLQLVPGAPTERTPPVIGPARRVMEEAVREGCVPWVDLAVAAGAGRELWDEDCERWIERPAGVPPGRHLAVRVTGDSMTPLLRAGDTILVRLGPEVVRGTVVVARRPDEGYVVKHVRAVRRRSVELASLNPGYAPVTVPRCDEAILGTVVVRWGVGGDGVCERPSRRT